MNQQPVSLQAMLPVVVTEARRHRVLLAGIFAALALAALAAGLLWPKKYEASTTILVQESNIIAPLMEGAATPTNNANRADIARAVILGHKVINQVMAAGGWLDGHPDPVEIDRMAQDIKARTRVQFTRDNLLTISYSDSDPERAYQTTRRFAQLFISESLASKQRESRDAFNFINNQVEAYKRKLTDAENKLKQFREANLDARPGSEAGTAQRINQLRSQVEAARMDLMEQRSKEASLQAQISGESEISTIQTAEGLYHARLAELQAQLDKLLLTYTDDYPDVVRTRHQMDDLRRQLSAAKLHAQDTQDGQSVALNATVKFNPLYQDIKSQLTTLRGQIAATSARLHASESILQTEIERSRRIAGSQNVIAELTRDYDVNRDVYQDLLKRRENARVSMNLDAKQQGLTFTVQNPATVPLIPTGLRLMHFAAAGIGMGIALPLGLLLGLARFDPRVRSVEQLQRMTGLPVLSSVPHFATPADHANERRRNLRLLVVVAAVAAAYLVVLILKFRGMA